VLNKLGHFRRRRVLAPVARLADGILGDGDGVRCERSVSVAWFTSHDLHSSFVTKARQSGLAAAEIEIAMLIGDKTGPAIIAQSCGDLRPEPTERKAGGGGAKPSE